MTACIFELCDATVTDHKKPMGFELCVGFSVIDRARARALISLRLSPIKANENASPDRLGCNARTATGYCIHWHLWHVTSIDAKPNEPSENPARYLY